MFNIDQIDPEWLFVFGVFSVATFVLSLFIVPMIIVRLPENYFLRSKRDVALWEGRNPILQSCLVALKNLAGLVLLIMGILMLILPGQGLLTMLFGIALMDFPGKYKLERRIVSQSAVLNSINWIRKKANKKPLLIN